MEAKKTDLKSLSKDQIATFCQEIGLERYRAGQIFQWLYQKGAQTFDEMTNLPAKLREQLVDVAVINGVTPYQQQQSKDKTTKFLFRLHDERLVESVLIPEFFDDGVADRLTVCVSSQVGCVFGCKFCATGKMGFFRNLTVGEIVDQVAFINKIALEQFGKRITNIVYMGMGEPFHNYNSVIGSAAIITDKLSIGLSPKRITISTVGLTKQIIRFADENQPYNLAISLHAPVDAKRDKIMPINESLNLKALKEALVHYHSITKKPVTYEYLLFDGFNDGEDDARNLSKIASWIPSKVNIIMYNQVGGVTLQRASEKRLNRFLKTLSANRTRATVRRSRGDDIDAGCGQLAIRDGAPKGKTIGKD